jgi:DNA-binding transcriptional MerR regulator
MAGPNIQRLYYSLREVSEMTGLKPYVLRAWESKFPRLNPVKSKTGRRQFRPSDLEVVLMIQKFKGSGFTDEKIQILLKHSQHGAEWEEEIEETRETKEKSRRKSGFHEIASGLREILSIIDEN